MAGAALCPALCEPSSHRRKSDPWLGKFIDKGNTLLFSTAAPVIILIVLEGSMKMQNRPLFSPCPQQVCTLEAQCPISLCPWRAFSQSLGAAHLHRRPTWAEGDHGLRALRCYCHLLCVFLSNSSSSSFPSLPLPPLLPPLLLPLPPPPPTQSTVILSLCTLGSS